MTKSKNQTSEEAGGSHRRRIHLREISGEADSPLETVGQDLRAARLRRGDDLATVSKALKIRKDHLEALEEDRIEALPGRTYAVGFVRTYAEYLGLNVQECLERFKREIQGRNTDDAPTVTVIDEDEHRKLSQGWKIIAVILVLLVLYGIYHWATAGGPVLSQQPVSDVPAQLTSNPQPAPPPATSAPAATAPSADQAAAPAQDTAAQPAAPDANAAPVATPPAQTAAAAPELPAGTVYGQRNNGARVVLKARQATLILVQGPDGFVYARRTLQPGDSFRVPNRVGVTLTTPNAGALQIDLDNSPMGTVGGDQQMIEALSLDPQAIVDRSNSRGRPPG